MSEPLAEVRDTGGGAVLVVGEEGDEFSFGNVETEVPVGFPVHLQHA